MHFDLFNSGKITKINSKQDANNDKIKRTKNELSYDIKKKQFRILQKIKKKIINIPRQLSVNDSVIKNDTEDVLIINDKKENYNLEQTKTSINYAFNYFEKIQAFENQDLLDAFNLIINNMSKINEDKKQSTLDKYFS